VGGPSQKGEGYPLWLPQRLGRFSAAAPQGVPVILRSATRLGRRRGTSIPGAERLEPPGRASLNLTALVSVAPLGKNRAGRALRPLQRERLFSPSPRCDFGKGRLRKSFRGNSPRPPRQLGSVPRSLEALVVLAPELFELIPDGAIERLLDNGEWFLRLFGEGDDLAAVLIV